HNVQAATKSGFLAPLGMTGCLWRRALTMPPPPCLVIVHETSHPLPSTCGIRRRDRREADRGLARAGRADGRAALGVRGGDLRAVLPAVGAQAQAEAGDARAAGPG